MRSARAPSTDAWNASTSPGGRGEELGSLRFARDDIKESGMTSRRDEKLRELRNFYLIQAWPGGLPILSRNQRLVPQFVFSSAASLPPLVMMLLRPI